MNKRTISTLLGLTLVSSLFINHRVEAAQKKEEINFATVGATAPYSYEENGKLTGYDVEVARAVFKGSKEYKVNFKKTEWSSIFTGLAADKYQIGANNISYSKERAEKFLYSYPIGISPSVITVPKDSPIKSFDDIGGHSTLVGQGSTTATQLEAYNKEHPDKPVDIRYTNEKITQILSHLSQGQIDFKIFEAPSVHQVIKNQKLDNLKTIELKSDQQPYIYFIFSKDQAKLQAYVNKRLKELQADGTLSKLAKQYLGGDYTPSTKELKIP